MACLICPGTTPTHKWKDVDLQAWREGASAECAFRDLLYKVAVKMCDEQVHQISYYDGRRGNQINFKMVTEKMILNAAWIYTEDGKIGRVLRGAPC